MTELEILALRSALQFIILCNKYFPRYQKPHLPKGDPRKCSLFKYCYKFVKETQGLLYDYEYKLYIQAQLEILKAIKINDLHPLIGPQCLAGDKAWIRWKMWKKKWQQKIGNKVKCEINEELIAQELKQTKKFLTGMFGGDWTAEQYQFMKNDMEKWVILGKVSPYYALLSPFFKLYCTVVTDDIDLNVYSGNINDFIKTIFLTLFVLES